MKSIEWFRETYNTNILRTNGIKITLSNGCSHVFGIEHGASDTI